MKVAIAGATGAVGIEILTLLEERNFPVTELILLASKRSAGKTLTFKGKEINISEMTPLQVSTMLFSQLVAIDHWNFAPVPPRQGQL